jgi:hypothetical protein
MSTVGQIWASSMADAVVLVLEELPDNAWVTHRVLVLDGHSSHFVTGQTRELNLSSINARWEKVS